MKYIILLIILFSLLYFILNKKEHFQNYIQQCFKDGKEVQYDANDVLTVYGCECYDEETEESRTFTSGDNFIAYKQYGNCNFYCPTDNENYIIINNKGSNCKCYDQKFGNLRKFGEDTDDIEALKKYDSCGYKLNSNWRSTKSVKGGVKTDNSKVLSYTMMYGDKKIIINNIPSVYQSLKVNSNNLNDVLGCKKDSDCYVGKCYAWEEGATGQCQKIYNIEMYEYGTDSSINLTEVDNLNISIEFVSIFNTTDSISIIKSEIKIQEHLWELKLNSNTIELYIMGKKQTTFESKSDNLINLKISNDTLYTFSVLVTPLKIKFNILDQNSDTSYEFEKSFYKLVDLPKTNIYECDSTESKKNEVCKVVFTNEYRRTFEKNNITFGGNKGYKIGGFKFGLDTNINKTCKFKNENGIQSECIQECNNQELCSEDDCNRKCNDAKVCNFDSKINYSRHSVDCMEKCINPNNKCETKYCKQQCWGCGSQCYWIKNSKFSEDNYDDGSGRPYPPNISLTNTSYDGSKASLKWEPPTQGSSEILGYVSLAYKTYKQEEGIKIDKIEIFNCNRYCEYVLSNLEPNETYSVVVRAYNSSGIGKVSNLITFDTLKKTVNTDILNSIVNPSKLEIGNFETC